jgi:hypothetical protein
MRRTASLRSSPGGLRLSLVLLASAIVFTDTVFYAAIVPLLPSYAADFAEAWLLVALVLVAAPCIGLLWSPSMAMVSDGAEARGVDQG